MEQMEERVPGADEQQLRHMLTDSPWAHQAVIDQVALEADQWLGGHRDSCLLIDESGFKKFGDHSAGLSCSDIEEFLKQFLPKRAVTQEEVFEQMEKRHKKRLASIRSHYAKQGIDLLE